MPATHVRATYVNKALQGPQLAYWAVVDAARRNGLVYELLEQHLKKFPGTAKSLFDGQAFLTMGREGPWLVAPQANSPLFTQWFGDGWVDSWGIFLATTEHDLDAVKLHLKKMLTAYVEDPDSNKELKALYRFYDPRVLRSTLPFFSAGFTQAMFGKVVTSYVVEGVRAASIDGRQVVNEIYRYSLAQETYLQKLAGVAALQSDTIALPLGHDTGAAMQQERPVHLPEQGRK